MDYENDPGRVYLRYPIDKLIEEQTRPYDSKKNVWIPDEEDGFAAAEIKAIKGDQATLKRMVPGNEPTEVRKNQRHVQLKFLNDASVLYNLSSRYGAMLIYTYSGLFCVVINPYKRLSIYTESVVKMFMGKRRTENLFAVSDEAYKNMLQEVATQNMNKFKAVQQQLQSAEERADVAENALQKPAADPALAELVIRLMAPFYEVQLRLV